MRIKIFYRKRFHPGKKLFSYIKHRPLGHIYHDPLIDIGGDDSHPVDCGDPSYGLKQGCEIRAPAFKHGGYVVVYQIPYKKVSLNRSEHPDQDTYHHQCKVRHILPRHIAHSADKEPAGVFDLYPGSPCHPSAAGTFYLSYLLISHLITFSQTVNQNHHCRLSATHRHLCISPMR